jgi:MYXO-CTERM domain-containing protein
VSGCSTGPSTPQGLLLLLLLLLLLAAVVMQQQGLGQLLRLLS